MPGFGNLQTTPRRFELPANVLLGANNGLSVDGTNAQLGGTAAAPSNLLNARVIQMNNQTIQFRSNAILSTDGFRINANGGLVLQNLNPSVQSWSPFFIDSTVDNGINNFNRNNSTGTFAAASFTAQMRDGVQARSQITMRTHADTHSIYPSETQLIATQAGNGMHFRVSARNAGPLTQYFAWEYGGVGGEVMRVDDLGSLMIGRNATLGAGYLLQVGDGVNNGQAYFLSNTAICATFKSGVGVAGNAMHIGFEGVDVAAASLTFWGNAGITAPAFRIAQSGSIRCFASIFTGDPTGGTTVNTSWRLGGNVAAAAALDPNNYLEVSVGGVLKKLALIV